VALQRPPLLHPPLQGALALVPLLARVNPLQMEQQGLGLKLGRLLQHRHQDAVPDVREGIGTGAPGPTRLLVVALGEVVWLFWTGPIVNL
jgi:hypothetical protein